MTSRSRRKHRITVRSIRPAARLVSSAPAARPRPILQPRPALLSLGCLAAFGLGPLAALAAPAGVRTPPYRFVESSEARPIHAAAASSAGPSAGSAARSARDVPSSASPVVRLKWRRRRPRQWSARDGSSPPESADRQVVRVSGVELIPASPPKRLKVQAAAQLTPLDPFSDPFGDKKTKAASAAQAVAPSAPGEADSGVPPQQTAPPLQAAPLPAPGPMLPPSPTESGPATPSARDDCQARIGGCRDELDQLLGNPISDISVDITPLFRPDIQEVSESIEDTQAKKKRLSGESIRPWRDRSGQTIATGQLVDFRDGRVHVQREDGKVVEIAAGRLSPEDVCHVTKVWNLPTECKLRDAAPPDRTAWLASTLTWKAPNTCHKPLYFEEPRLERYGHSSGPLLQPVFSGAHFFLNIAALPYKMGIHPPMECRYPLGYYEPGDCAPYLVPPLPISLRGGLLEAGVITGGVFALP